MSAEKREDPRLERRLLAGLLLLLAAAGAAELLSPVARRLRGGRPLVAKLELRDAQAGAPGRYLLAYLPRSGVLHLVFLPPPGQAPKRRRGELVQAPAAELPMEDFSLSWTLPAGAGPASSPEAARAWLLSWPRDARFWARLPRAWRALRRAARPSLEAYGFLLLAFEAYRLEPGSVRLAWLPEPDGMRRLADILSGGAAPPPPFPLRVEVLNGSGEPGVAMRATKVLRWRGFDVVDFGNAAPSERTHLVDRWGDGGAAAAGAAALGCGAAEVMTRVDLGAHASVAAVLGRDFSSCGKLAE